MSEAPETRQRILMIDDDQKLCRLAAAYLAPMGFDVVSVHNGTEGAARACDASQGWSAVILDVMLPGLDGLQVLGQIRKSTRLPVLMLTARSDETDRVVGLEMGADDYLPKTFSSRELLARLRAVLRRSTPSAAATSEPVREVVVGTLRINLDARTALMGSRPVELTPAEFQILAGLASACGRVKSREALLDLCSDRNYENFDRSIDVHISSLRRKLGDDPRNPRLIRTVRSAGYMMVAPEA